MKYSALKNTQNHKKYTVLMSVYAKEDPYYLSQSIVSILSQSVKPDEILILKDGPLTDELDDLLNELQSRNVDTVKIVSFKQNRGLGKVLADGVMLSKNKFIARMDSDDIANVYRCELQLNEFLRDPTLDIVGSNVTEFTDNVDNVKSTRKMPENHEEILVFSHKRNPFAHPSVMFKKDSVLAAGNYRSFKFCEDYDLWVRMILNGAKCYNVQKNLVSMRISSDFYKRRGGANYVKSIVKFKKELHDIGHFNKKDFILSAASTVLVGLMPNYIRSKLYTHILRKQEPVSKDDSANLVLEAAFDQSSIVSVIIPVYNAEIYLQDTILSLQNQTYTNWEAIFVDDCSTDNSVDLIKSFAKTDSRIKLLKNSVNSYAALTRNKGISAAKGRYIAFLDADDLWKPTKLEKQIAFMNGAKCVFSFTSYEYADKTGKPNGKKVRVPKTITYEQALKNTTIWTSTVMLDMDKITKEEIYMPNIRRGQDTATWWKILKKIDYAYGIDAVLSYYRRTSDSLSANKLIALRRTWLIYRNVENLGIIESSYSFIWYVHRAVLRRI